MAILSFEEIEKSLKNNKSGIYFLCGDEPYFINLLLENFSIRIDTFIFSGDNYNIKNITNEYLQSNIFEKKRIIIVKNVEKCNDFKKVEKIKILDSFLDENLNENILIFYHNGKLLKTNDLYKIFIKYNLFISNKLTYLQLKQFLKQYCLNKNIIIKDKAIDIFIDCETNLSKIISQINLLSQRKNTIDEKMIETEIEIPKQKQFDFFEFITLLANKKNLNKIMIFIKNFQNNNSSSDIFQLFGLFYSFFTKTLIYKKHNINCPFFYKIASKNYSEEKILNIIKELKNCDNYMKNITYSTSLSPYNILSYITNIIITQ